MYPAGLLGEALDPMLPTARSRGRYSRAQPLCYLEPEAAATPIILLHGYFHNRSGFLVMRRALSRYGFRHVFTMNYNVIGHDVEELAAQLKGYVENVLNRTGATRVHLVGHSLGGLVARTYVQEIGGDERVHTCITLGTPHQGTYAAWAGRGRAARQIRPRSELLDRLDEPRSRHRSLRLLLFEPRPARDPGVQREAHHAGSGSDEHPHEGSRAHQLPALGRADPFGRQHAFEPRRHRAGERNAAPEADERQAERSRVRRTQLVLVRRHVRRLVLLPPARETLPHRLQDRERDDGEQRGGRGSEIEAHPNGEPNRGRDPQACGGREPANRRAVSQDRPAAEEPDPDDDLAGDASHVGVHRRDRLSSGEILEPERADECEQARAERDEHVGRKRAG